MYPQIMHICGPFAIQSYGVMIVLGFLAFLFFTYHNENRRQIIDDDAYLNALFLGLIAGLVGGRGLFVFYEWNTFSKNVFDIFAVWEGGFVVLGTILGVIFTLPIYLLYKRIHVFKFFDLIATYVPLMQAIARIGCLLAGCCYGAACDVSWMSIIFNNSQGMAPLNIPLYPTQIYLSLASILIFCILITFGRRFLRKNGQIFFAYICLDSVARFFVDFYRGDRGNITSFSFFDFGLSLSEIQLWLIVVFAIGIAFFAFVSWLRKT